MINLEKIHHDISELPEEAQTLVIDFIESLKKRYSVVTAFFKIMRYIPPAPCPLPSASCLQATICAPHQYEKCYKSTLPIDNQSSTLDILKESGLIGCISAESDLSINFIFLG